MFLLGPAAGALFPHSILDSGTWPAPIASACVVVVLGITLVAPIYR